VLKGLERNPKTSRKNTVPSKHFEAKSFGQIIQVDTCISAWLKGEKHQSLIVCLDDCSRFIVSAGIFSTDSTWTNMCIIKNMIKEWGLPSMLYTDNASHFKTIRHEKLPAWIDKSAYPLTRIQQVLAELGITHVTHHPFNPRAKGKIERFFQVHSGSAPQE
jgi:transposase InsO family protein